MAVSKRTRFEVLRRDNFTCRYCGASAPDVKLTVDHVLPVALGGPNAATNLVAACAPCNAGKSSTGPNENIVAEVDEKALKWAMAREVAKRRMSESRTKNREIHDKFLTLWTKWDRNGALLPTNWSSGIDQWLDAGMVEADIADAYNIAICAYGVPATSVYRYMVGVINKRIVALDDATAEVMGSLNHDK